MSKFNRIFSVVMGIGCTSTVLLVVKHLMEPSYVTIQMTNAILVPVSVLLSYVAYDSFKEGLTGRKA